MYPLYHVLTVAFVRIGSIGRYVLSVSQYLVTCENGSISPVYEHTSHEWYGRSFKVHLITECLSFVWVLRYLLVIYIYIVFLLLSAPAVTRVSSCTASQTGLKPITERYCKIPFCGWLAGCRWWLNYTGVYTPHTLPKPTVFSFASSTSRISKGTVHDVLLGQGYLFSCNVFIDPFNCSDLGQGF